MLGKPFEGHLVLSEDQQAVRDELAASRGARQCPFSGCGVITQGGFEGLMKHQGVCHSQPAAADE